MKGLLFQIWQIKEDFDGKGVVEFLANLKRHTKAVNVCRFSPDGKQLNKVEHFLHKIKKLNSKAKHKTVILLYVNM